MDSDRRDTLFPSAKVFCNLQLLEALQNSPLRPFEDSKTLVDLELKLEPDEVLRLFASFPKQPCRDEFDSFMDEVFMAPDDSVGDVVRSTVPVDYSDAMPLYMKELREPSDKLIAFVSDLKGRWRELCRETVDGVHCKLSTHSSLIPLPFPFFIPGGRFRECYYWDTLWTVKGLVASDMLKSAKAAVRNLLHLVDRIGFVPNGNRVYYLNRSQPPLLTEAVKVVFDATESTAEQIEWLEEAVPMLDKEYNWFCENRSVSSKYPSEAFSGRSLSVYYADTVHPRPESFKEDTASLDRRLQTPLRVYEESTSTSLYKNLASAAESGWDFSSRWFLESDERRLESIQICRIVPVCLNSILLKAEKDLSSFHRLLAEQKGSAREDSRTVKSNRLGCDMDHDSHLELSIQYDHLAKKRAAEMCDLLWNQEEGFWFDYSLQFGSCTKVVSCAGIMPVWAGCGVEKWELADAKRFVDFLVHHSGLLQLGGLSCTNQTSAEQWDFPNCWPPLIDFAVEALQRLGKRFPASGAEMAAETIAMRFLETALKGWSRDSNMHEKYDSRVKCGNRGTGGEYAPQTGFGWTNGTILWLLRDFADHLNSRLVPHMHPLK